MKIINDLNIKKQAAELGVNVWQAPSFLFMMMGVINIIAMTATYYISKNYENPELVVMAESVVVATIFIIGNSIIRGMEQMARLNKMKSEFISVASHQLRTPLSAIKWETELVLAKFKDGLSDKQINALESIHLLGGRMARLVNDLLDVAKIDQGKMILQKQPVDLAKTAEEVIAYVALLANAKNTKIIFEKDDENYPKVVGDAEKLKLVIENLLSNAVKYTLSQGSVAISLRREKDEMVFSVKDNGVGIPEDQQKQVFSKFFRSNNIARYQTEGTGLGLYIAKNVVEELDGKMWFESEENKGTKFSFSLPISK